MDQPNARLKFVDHTTTSNPKDKASRLMHGEITDNGKVLMIEGAGTGPIDGFTDALSKYLGISMSVMDYSEHSLKQGSNAAAICYMEVEIEGKKIFGVGINTNIVAASLEALISATNRYLA